MLKHLKDWVEDLKSRDVKHFSHIATNNMGVTLKKVENAYKLRKVIPRKRPYFPTFIRTNEENTLARNFYEIPECNILNFITNRLGIKSNIRFTKISFTLGRIHNDLSTKNWEDPNLNFEQTAKKNCQSEFFFQFYRTLILGFIEWDWSDSDKNVPRLVHKKVSEVMYPNGSGEVTIPQLADLILIPNSDWYKKQNFVEIGKTWKTAYEDTTSILNGLGMFIPNINKSPNTIGKYLHS